MARSVNGRLWRAERLRAFVFLYGYTALSALAVASLTTQELAQLANASTLDSLLASSREGSLVWSDLTWRALEAVPHWIGLGCLWLLVALGSFAPKLYWLRCLGPRPHPPLTVAQALKLLRQALAVRAVTCFAQLWCWGFGWCTGISIATVLRHTTDERLLSLLTWSPLALVAPFALAVGAQEQLVRIALVAAQSRQAAGSIHPLYGYTIREAIGTALTATGRHPWKTVGLYLLTLPAPLLIAWIAGVFPQSLGSSATLQLILQQLPVLAVLGLTGWWQIRMVRLLEPPAHPMASARGTPVNL